MSAVFSEQYFSHLVVANGHGDPPARISSLIKAKDFLLSVNSSLCAEILPHFLELHTSADSNVRKCLVELLGEIGSKRIELCHMLVPLLLTFLKDDDAALANRSISTGTSLICCVLEGIVSQCEAKHGKIEKWLEEQWLWTNKFKEAVSAIVLEPCFVGTKMVAMKFLEKCILLFTSHNDAYEINVTTATKDGRFCFNISSLTGVHPLLDPAALTSEANTFFNVLLRFLQSSSDLPVSLTITAIHCLSSIARKRPIHFSTVFSTLIDLESRMRCSTTGNVMSIMYSIRSALLGFLRCTHPSIRESRDKLVRALQSLNAGDVADHVIRQVDKMAKDNERASRDTRVTKVAALQDPRRSPLLSTASTSPNSTDDGIPHSHMYISGDHLKKRPIQESEETTCEEDVINKRICRSVNTDVSLPIRLNESRSDEKFYNSPNVSVLDNDMNPVEQMIAMMGALIAEGECGAKSLELLVLNIHPDLLADIVILNMKHLPKSAPPLTGLGNSFPSGQSDSFSTPLSAEAETPGLTDPLQCSVIMPKLSSASSIPDSPAVVNTDAKRDPRRDPRRSDPRRPMVSFGAAPTNIVVEEEDFGQSKIGSAALPQLPPANKIFPAAQMPLSNGYDHMLQTRLFIATDKESSAQDSISEVKKVSRDLDSFSNVTISEDFFSAQDSVGQMKPGIAAAYISDSIPPAEVLPISPTTSNIPESQEISADLCEPLPCAELTSAEKITVRMLAVQHIICSWKHLLSMECDQTRMELLARLLDQVDGDKEMILLLQKNIILDYQHRKGHEVVLHILYYLHGLAVSDADEHTLLYAVLYENFLVVMAKSLLDNFPASDRSFSRLLGDVPILPDSVIKLLDELCHNDIFDGGGKELRDIDRVTQGLGAVWSLILGRPPYRKVCLDIAMKCAIHSQDEIRSKAIRLVANKLFILAYTSDVIEQFATNMLLSSIDKKGAEKEEAIVDNHEKSVSSSEISALQTSLYDVKVMNNTGGSDSNTMTQRTQCLISLYFALCMKKPSLLKLVFAVFEKAPKIVKQAFIRHIPVLVRVLGSSCSDLLRIISDPPQGSENLLSQVLQVLAEGGSPSPELTSIVKHLYETKLKDVSILIPMLSSFTKTEVLPIFPQLVKLPLEKLQLALAYILQGSAHTGPALTPVEVLVAIHDISPEKDDIPLKKVTDACSTCFEQRTVFTQQVLVKALNQMVEQTPLPLLFMRTVIQAIDAFPTMVDFVMEILSKLVCKQVWKMPKLWFGFLKCVSQTKPHSFNVLLQLPPLQLESALTRHAHLRAPLSTYADQSLVRSSLSREILGLLGMGKERQLLMPALHSSDANSSIHGAMPS